MLSIDVLPVNRQADTACPLTASTRSKFTEPLPKTEDILLPGMIVSSPGGTIQYQIMSHPFCRIYWEKGKATPHSYASSWYEDENGKWKRNGANKLSYLVRIIGGKEVFPWTFRIRPQILDTESIPDWEGTYCHVEQHS